MFELAGLTPLRRFMISFEGIGDAVDRTGFIHTPPIGRDWRQANLVLVGGGGGGRGGGVDGGVSGPFDGGMWERVAQRLSVPWHGVDLVMHMGYGVEDSPFTQPLAEVIH